MKTDDISGSCLSAWLENSDMNHMICLNHDMSGSCHVWIMSCLDHVMSGSCLPEPRSATWITWHVWIITCLDHAMSGSWHFWIMTYLDHDMSGSWHIWIMTCLDHVSESGLVSSLCPGGLWSTACMLLLPLQICGRSKKWVISRNLQNFKSISKLKWFSKAKEKSFKTQIRIFHWTTLL